MRPSFAIALIVVAAAGVGIGLLLQPPHAPHGTTTSVPAATSPNSDTVPADIDTDNPDVAALHTLLQQEIKARQALEQKVTALSDQLARITNHKSSPSSQQTAEQSASQSETQGEEATAAGAEQSETWFNQQALLDAGLGDAEAERLKLFYEDMEMQRLYLRDRAIREGWAGSRRFRDELQQLNGQEEELRNQLSEAAYDAYLYASGQPNRVVVQSVLASAPAATAGIQAGDHVLRYDNKRIYGWRELREATAEGNINDTVAIEVERNGQRMQLFVPRGPLGIRMTSASEAP